MTTFTSLLGETARKANIRLAGALRNQAEKDREVTAALIEQREVMAALRAVSPDHSESTRGLTLESQAQGHAFLGTEGEAE